MRCNQCGIVLKVLQNLGNKSTIKFDERTETTPSALPAVPWLMTILWNNPVSDAMHAIHARVRCCQPPAPAVASRAARGCLHACTALKRRDVILGTAGFISGSDCVAAATEQEPLRDSTVAAAPAAADAGPVSQDAARPAAAVKPKKKKRKRPPTAARQKSAALKPPGTVPRVKLAENLVISQVGSGALVQSNPADNLDLNHFSALYCPWTRKLRCLLTASACAAKPEVI